MMQLEILRLQTPQLMQLGILRLQTPQLMQPGILRLRTLQLMQPLQMQSGPEKQRRSGQHQDGTISQ